MSVFIDQSTRLVIQGITGRDGSFHAKQMMAYGTKVVAGVTPGKGGQQFEDSVPVFNTVADAVRERRANTAVIYVPAAVAASAIFEAADAGVQLIICITEGIPVLDMTRVLPFVHERGCVRHRSYDRHAPASSRLVKAKWESSPATSASLARSASCRAAAR